MTFRIPLDKKRVVQLITEKGLPPHIVAKRFGTSRFRIFKIMEEFNIKHHQAVRVID